MRVKKWYTIGIAVALLSLGAVACGGSSQSQAPAPPPDAPFSIVQAHFQGRAQKVAMGVSTVYWTATVSSCTLEKQNRGHAVGIVVLHLQSNVVPSMQMDRTFMFDVTYDPRTGDLLYIDNYHSGAGTAQSDSGANS